MPATVVAKQPDAGHLMPGSVDPKAAQSTPRMGASSPGLALPHSKTPAAVGLLDAAYFSESDSDMTDALPQSAQRTIAVAPDSTTVGFQAGPDRIDMIDIVYFCDSDADSAGSPRPSALATLEAGGLTDLPGSPDLLQPTAAPGSVARSAALPAGLAHRVSPLSSSPASGVLTAPEVQLTFPADQGHVSARHTQGLDDRWQMEDDMAPALSRAFAADLPASRLSSQVHASPSYDPRYQAEAHSFDNYSHMAFATEQTADPCQVKAACHQ